MSGQFKRPARARTRRRLADRMAHVLFLTATLLAIGVLVLLLKDVVVQGLPWLSWDFLNNFPSRFPAKAGLKSALFGSLWLIAITALVAYFVGVATAIYLEEYARDNWLSRLIEVNISNLAGVPSIVYGLLGLTIFVRTLAMGRSVLAGALTMSLLVLPIIIVASREAIRTVPQSLRHGAFALGATRWQMVRRVVLPSAFPGILTGTILALSRALGETAPLITIGALTFVAFIPQHPLDSFTALPIQIYNWTSRPQEDFRGIAAAGIVVLLGVLLSMNAVAIFLRNRYQKRVDY